jgi:putative NADH-flavin reductase
MRIAVLGATGRIGRAIAREALDRGHEVTGIARTPCGLGLASRLRLAAADATKADEVARVVSGHDAVVNAVGPAPDGPASVVASAAAALLAATRRAGIKRLLQVGDAGTLYVKPGLEWLDAPDFPAAWRAVALAHREALRAYREVDDLEWTYVSPPATVAEGARTGRYRIGRDELLVDGEGESRISIEDYAVAVVDELERGAYKGSRITVASS